MPKLHYEHPDLAALYDLDSGWSVDRDFYLGLATGGPKRILDLGCGTVFLCDAYASLGHQVTGANPARPCWRLPGDDQMNLASSGWRVPPRRSAQTSGANLTFESRLTSSARSNVKFKSSTRIKNLLVVLMTPTFAPRAVSGGCKCRSRTTRCSI